MATQIGIYGEKTLHRELKWMIEPTGAYHEVPVGKHIADIKTESGIIEIQTQSLHRLRGKLAAFLPDYIVTLVYPMPHEKLILWMDAENGEILRTRRSPRRGSYYTAFRELYYIKHLLISENLRLRLILLDVSERRIGGGWRKRYHKIDTDIRSVYGELAINNLADYQLLVPTMLSEPFTSRSYAAATGLNMKDSGVALNVLYHVGAVERIGKTGNSYLYVRHARGSLQ